MKFPALAPLAAGCMLLFLTVGVASAAPKKAAEAADPSSKKDTKFKPPQDDTVRLQIYLDEQNFGPGKIDGEYGGFTKKSWLRFQEAQGTKMPDEKFDAKKFTSVDPTYVSYTVTAEDLSAIGPVPTAIPEQAKLKALTYTDMPELIGERYHVSVTFLKRLNAPQNLDKLKEGDKVRVPNVVPPFNLAQVIALRQYTKERAKLIKDAKEKVEKNEPAPSPTPSAETVPTEMPGPTVAVSAAAPPAEAVPSPSPQPAGSPAAKEEAAADATGEPAKSDNKPVLRAGPADSKALVFHVSTKDSYLEIRGPEDKLVACFPITPGSTAIPTPKGEWKVVAKTLLPEFRWDKSVLMTGKRSSTAYQLPPGPNNPVGVTWIALSKPGIGMHGTNSPDTIGRSASHGCIRLSNWDAFKVFGMVAPGTKVLID